MDTINELYAKITEHKQYLQSTDYHRLKAAEGNYIIPVEIIEQSRFARQEIDRLRLEINVLEDELNQVIEKLSTEVQNAEGIEVVEE